MKRSMYCVVLSNGDHRYFISKEAATRALVKEHLNNKHSSAHMLCFQESFDGTMYLLKQKTFMVGLDTYMLNKGFTEYDVTFDLKLITSCMHHTFL